VRSADDYYPAASLRLQESGTAIVQVCVAPSGRLEGAPAIQQSSGSPRLDAAALKWAREALRFTPATRGGVPISACKGFRVNFKLH
jgi:protein TonB